MHDITPYWPVLGTLLFALLTAKLVLRYAPPSPPEPGRQLAIDGLRGYLALGVFLSHGANWFVYMHTGDWKSPPSHLYGHLSSSGVALFFMITAFLFTQKILDQDRRPIAWKRLFVSRAFRLAPLYLLALTLLVLMAFTVTGFAMNEPFTALARRLAYWLVFTIPGAQPVNLLGDTVLLIVGVWSLPYEWMFYAALPALALLLRRPASLPWVLASMLATALIVHSMPGFDAIHLRSFSSGILAALACRHESLRARLSAERGPWGAVALLLATAAVLLYPNIYSWPPLLCMAAAFVIVACGNPLYGILSSPLSRFLGEISYGIYLLHGLWLYGVYELLVRKFMTGLTPVQHWQIVLAIVPLLVLSSYAAYRLAEAPGIAYGRKLVRS